MSRRAPTARIPSASEVPGTLIVLSYIETPALYACTTGQVYSPPPQASYLVSEQTPAPSVERELLARYILDADGAGALLPYAPARITSLAMSWKVLFSAMTSNEPISQRPFQPSTGPMSLLWITTSLDSMAIPDDSDAPSSSLPTIFAKPPWKTVIGAPSAVVISLAVTSIEKSTLEIDFLLLISMPLQFTLNSELEIVPDE